MSKRCTVPVSTSLLLLLLTCIAGSSALATSGRRQQAPHGRGGAASSRSKTWHALRKSGVKSKGRSNPPRWEKEGDSLYHAVIAGGRGGSVKKARSLEEARDMLSELGPPADSAVRKETSRVPKKINGKKKISAPPHTLWGELPVGPVLRKHLLDASLPAPTPVQSTAFSVIASGKNAVIASPTGTGKSLAYLLPLLASSKGRNVPCSMMVLTPTVELASQLKREVDKLWPPEGQRSAMHVVDRSENKDIDPDPLSRIRGAPILAGTPRSLRALLAEADAAALRNLKAVVLDEADRLLRTEHKARDTGEARGRVAKTQAEQLLRELPVPLRSLQVVCASATVGRTLRRQLMDLLQTPSLDKTAVLVTAEGDVRTGKNAERRKASLLPDTIRHFYRLLPEEEDIVEGLRGTMEMMEPSPSLVFPGKLGVDAVQKELMQHGMNNILGLTDIHLCENLSTDTWNDAQIFVIRDKFARGLDVPKIKQVFLLSPPSSAAGYTHLAGRTGRNGKEGTAITLIRPSEAHKLLAIADALGLCFEELKSESGERYADEGESENSAGETHPWAALSEASLKRKTVAELTEYLTEHGISLSNDSGIDERQTGSHVSLYHQSENWWKACRPIRIRFRQIARSHENRSMV